MQNFKITDMNGIIDGVELRCIGFYQKYSKGWQEELVIPPHAKKCITFISDQKGTTFSLVHTAK
jgi:hypothetical protein